MKAIMVMFDSLNRHFLEPYGCKWTDTPQFSRLAQNSVVFDNCWVGSMPCMPARRELHTGRYNFLHRSWGPLEPFDDSMPEILKNNGIHSHLISDHYHYWEDGGATYHQRYRTWEIIRGQEGDAWYPLVGYSGKDILHCNRSGKPEDHWVEQDFANRSVMDCVEKQPQSQTFEKGLEFLDKNHAKDSWFLQIETFDPHEPFFVQESYKKNFPDQYVGPLCDWPRYSRVTEEDDEAYIDHMRKQYAALLKMCDDSLGKVLDAMDRYDLWKDTMLIVNTDHGHLLSEHGQWAKCHCPFYREVSQTPLFIWDPRFGKRGERRNQLVQTIDLPATILEYFGLPLPSDMQGKPLREVLDEKNIREAALFGIFGGQIGCTDGDWVYLRSPEKNNSPRYEYTLMPTRHGPRRAFMEDERLRQLNLHEPFTFTKGMPVLQVPDQSRISQAEYPTELYYLPDDPEQSQQLEHPEQEKRMLNLMRQLMKETDCPVEQYTRMGIPV